MFQNFQQKTVFQHICEKFPFLTLRGRLFELTSRDRPKSAPYPRLKNSKKTSKCQVFSFTVLENRKNQKKWTEWRAE